MKAWVRNWWSSLLTQTSKTIRLKGSTLFERITLK